jgi:aspartokinase
MEKLKVGGLKRSLELCQFDLRGRESSEKTVSKISKLLASQKCNIEFLTYNPKSNRSPQLTLCVSQDQSSRTSEILKKDGMLPPGWHMTCREHVGILTVFPHHSATQILAVIMVSWGRQSIPVYGIATSLSAISFVTDYHIIDTAVEAIQDSLQLPENRTPLKPEIRYYQSDIVKGD